MRYYNRINSDYKESLLSNKNTEETIKEKWENGGK